MQDATVAPTQSAPQVSPTQPTRYAAPVAQPAAQAPAVGTTPQWVAPSQPMAAPMPQVQAQMGVPTYQSTPTVSYPQAPQAAPQAENPYREAFNKVVGALSSPVQFPFQGQQSSQTPVVDPASYASQQAAQYSNAVAPISTPGINNSQDLSNNYSQTSLEITPDQLRANGVSETSLQVIDHFGPNAAEDLNTYSCQLEDHLIATNQQLGESVALLKELSAEHKAYEQILTNPDVLADYTCEFFGPNGPYPVSQQGQAPQGQQVGQQFQNADRPHTIPTAPAPAAKPATTAPAPQRPSMPAPPSPQPQGTPQDFWNNFGSAADRDPQNAWRYLNAAQQNPEVFRNKLLVME